MKVNRVIMTILGAACSSLVCAADADDGTWRPGATLSLASAWSSPGKTQTIYMQPELPETFAANSATEVFGDGEIFLSLQHRLARHLQIQLGLAAAGTTAIPLNGDIWQDADPNFNALSYDYRVSHRQLTLKGKLFTDVYQRAQPYISGSLGVGFNHAYQYGSTSKLFETLPEPPFASQTTTAFTYTLGVGLQRALNSHWSIGVGYEFADWGKTSLASAPGQLSNGGLSLDHIYTNKLQFSLSFIA